MRRIIYVDNFSKDEWRQIIDFLFLDKDLSFNENYTNWFLLNKVLDETIFIFLSKEEKYSFLILETEDDQFISNEYDITNFNNLLKSIERNQIIEKILK